MQEITLKIDAEVEPVIKQLHLAAVFLKRVRQEKGGGFSVTLNKKDSEKTFAILKKMCYNYTMVKVKSFSAFYSFFLKRAGLIFGTALVIGICIALSLFSFKVDINGLDRLDEDRVRTLLRASGLSEFSLREEFTTENVRAALLPLDDILDVTVKRIGGKIVIEIIERAEVEKPLVFAEDIVSRFDCVVTRVSAVHGESLVKPGAIIKKGTKVIGAFTTDSNGNKISSSASGEVYGKVVFSKRIVAPSIMNKRERTGKTYISTDALFKSFTFIKGGIPSFNEYDKVSTTVCGFNNNFLPLYFTRTVYYETAEVVEETDGSVLAEKSLQEFYTFSISSEKTVEEKKWFKITEVEGFMLIDLFIEAEILVN